uniref:RNA-binding protein n=1 Tax=Solanum tuberosum TaxID=4113 RepID=M1AD85_SOLTU
MAAGAKEVSGETTVVEAPAVQSLSSPNTDNTSNNSESNGVKDSADSIANAKSEFHMHDIADMLKKLKLNPQAKEFFPSSYNRAAGGDQMILSNFVPANKTMGVDGFQNNRRRGNNFNQGKRRMNNRAYKAQREDSIRRTVYVSEIDNNVTEEQLAALFSAYGQVVDCRICGDPHSRLRFAFVEFADECFSQLKVLPSKTAILPVNPTFLPRSEDEREMCARTVYCTNIDKKVTQADVKNFFETRCGEVSRLRLLGDHVHSTRIAFVEFVMAESAILALDCCGEVLGSQRISVYLQPEWFNDARSSQFDHLSLDVLYMFLIAQSASFPHPDFNYKNSTMVDCDIGVRSTENMSTDRNDRDKVKVVIINTEYIETDARNFKSIVQKLTGKDAGSVEPDHVKMSKFKSNNPSTNLDNLLKLELPSFDNLFYPNYGD